MRQNYIPEFDGLRAIAALAVIAFHSRVSGIAGGFLGVDVFFVLSGYLTASIALSRKFTVWEFMERRLLRILPLMVSVTIVVIAFLITLDVPITYTFIPNLHFLGNIAGFTEFLPVRNDQLNHLWTLSTEIQFYLLVVILAVFLSKRMFLIVCGASFLFVTCVRIALGIDMAIEHSYTSWGARLHRAVGAQFWFVPWGLHSRSAEPSYSVA